MESKWMLLNPVRRQRALIVGLSLLATPLAASAETQTCLTGASPSAAQDVAQIAALRRLIDSSCVCSSFDGSEGKAHRDYVACATDIIRAQAESSTANLRAACVGTVTQIYKQSTCGTDPSLNAVPCLRISKSNGNVACSIKATTRKDGITASRRCSDNPISRQVACSGYTTCLDAADTNTDLTIAAPGDNGACGPAPTSTPTATPTSSPTPTSAGVDCVVSDWSAWSKCTKACGGGMQTRTRSIITPPENGGAACPVLEETQPCNEWPCPIDCVVSAWSDWSTCSASCGGGTQRRTRSVVTSPAYGGYPCPTLVDTQACNKQSCDKRVFITSESYFSDGAFGGLDQGDAICQNAADSVSLGGIWTAWLSTSTVDARDRIPDAVFRLIDGTLVANSKADLLDGSIAVPITLAENGTTVDSGDVHTGTNADGTRGDVNCLDWTSAGNFPDFNYLRGTSSATTGAWTQSNTQGCDQVVPMYCFEQ